MIAANNSKKLAALALAAAAIGCGPMGLSFAPPRAKVCTHSYGLAGGFTECSGCGIRRKKRSGP